MTLVFDEPISNPILVFASIGSGGTPAPIKFNQPLDILWKNDVEIKK